MPSDLEIEVLRHARERLAEARRGARDAVLREAATALGVSVSTVYRKLGDVGFDSGRRRRRDAGETRLDHEELRLISGVLASSANKKGQRMPVETAMSMLRASGALTSEVSVSTVTRQLHERHLHPEQLLAPSTAVQLSSSHPNHVWQVDSTTGSYYYMPGGRLRWMDEAEFNKNKPANLVKAATDLLTRYAVVDHTTHAFKVRYFLGGETTQNLMEFLVWSICRQPAGPMHGVPHILMADQGPANKSHLVAEFCRTLGISLMLHAPGNARATGSVEKVHDLARMHLEPRYRFQNPAEVTIDRLNLEAEAWAAHFCTYRTHGRLRTTRVEAWMRIAEFPGALRVPASEAALREAATSRPQQVRVDNTRRVSFKGRTYLLEQVPGAYPAARVTIALNVYRSPAIDVQVVDVDTGDVTWHVVEPEVRNEWGFDGRRVIGEGFQGATNTIADDTRNRLRREAYRLEDGLPTLAEAEAKRKRHAQAYAGIVDAMADVRATPAPAFMPQRRAETIELPRRQVEAVRLSVVEACRRLRDRLGGAYQPSTFQLVQSEFPDGVPEDRIDDLVQRLTQPDPAATPAPSGLRIVNGGAA